MRFFSPRRPITGRRGTPHVDNTPFQIYRVGQKSKLFILSEFVNKTEKMGGM